MASASRARDSLEKAFKKNPSITFVGTRLARSYLSESNVDGAVETLSQVIDRNPNDRIARLALSRIEFAIGKKSIDEIIAQTEGAVPKDESNVDDLVLIMALYWKQGDRDKYNGVRERLRSLDMPFEARRKLILWDGFEGAPRAHSASIVKADASYAFVAIEGIAIPAMMHANAIGAEALADYSYGDRLQAIVGFSALGAQALPTSKG